MRKKFTIFLILIFALDLMPLNFSNAITQNQINAEVQIVCTDGAGNWFSGSGTIIDPKGIILTNRHVIEGAYMNTCFIGFIESIDQEPNFGTEGNYNLAEVKYFTTTEDMDAAILYLDNPTNKLYPYVDIWNSNSNSLQFGEKIEVIGFPGIGGSTITYTSGDFSGFGSVSDGTKNYIKTTALLEHGNSGGAAYNSNGQFIGIPTMVIPGQLNSIAYILSVNSIKNWISSLLGPDCKNEIIEQEPIIKNKNLDINIQWDTKPPIQDFAFDIYGIDSMGKEMYIYKKGDFVINSYRTIRIAKWSASQQYTVIYSYSDKPGKLFETDNTFKYVLNEYQGNNNPYEKEPIHWISNKIYLNKGNGVYYIGIKLRDEAGNTSDPRILTYVYEDENFLKLKNIKFYSDENYSNMIGNYDFNLPKAGSSPSLYRYKTTESQYYSYCLTNKKNIYIKWQYDKNYSTYDVKIYNEHGSVKGGGVIYMDEKDSMEKGGIYKTASNKYAVTNLDTSKENGFLRDESDKMPGDFICVGDTCGITGKVSVLQLKPRIDDNIDSYLGGKYTVIKFIYNPDQDHELICGGRDLIKGDYIDENNIYRGAFYTLKPGKALVEDSIEFDKNQEEIYKDYLSTHQNSTDINKSKNGHDMIDMEFAEKIKGVILLQVEQNGEAWYVNPDNKKRYYLGRPVDAFKIMRELGLGATHHFITSHTIFPTNVLGKILIDVEQNGEAYYIYPKDKKAYYLGRPADAFKIMRELGLGITNSDLSKIPEDSL